jgi:hypothetical protein
MSRSLIALLGLLGALSLNAAASAQTAPPLQTPDQIQAMIANGQTGQAVQALDNVLAVHSNDARAWYLLAEAEDARNDEADAGTALNMAERCDPGLYFVNPQGLAALKSHIAAAQPHDAISGRDSLLLGGGLVLLVVLLSFAPSRKEKPPTPGKVQREPPYGFGYDPKTGLVPKQKPAKTDASHDDVSNTRLS